MTTEKTTMPRAVFDAICADLQSAFTVALGFSLVWVVMGLIFLRRCRTTDDLSTAGLAGFFTGVCVMLFFREMGRAAKAVESMHYWRSRFAPVDGDGV